MMPMLRYLTASQSVLADAASLAADAINVEFGHIAPSGPKPAILVPLVSLKQEKGAD